MLSTVGRAAVKRIGGGVSTSTNRALLSLWQSQRAEYPQSHNSSTAQTPLWLKVARYYATATTGAAKPKTSRTTAKAGTAKSTTKAKPKPKAKKPAAKKKPAKKKPAAKKPKPKKKVKKPLTEEQKVKAQVKQLKVKALLAEEPKSLPSTAWLVFLEREAKNTSTNAATLAANASSKYKTLSPSEIESLNQEANSNKAKSTVAYKQWVESHTPLQIKEANNARRLLRRVQNVPRGHKIIDDERIPKRPKGALMFFTRDRHASGDLKGVGDFTAVNKLINSEWKALSDVERKRYDDLAAADQDRYAQEVKTVFSRDVRAASS